MRDFECIESFKVRKRQIVPEDGSPSFEFLKSYVIPHGIKFSANDYKIYFKNSSKSPKIFLFPKKIDSKIGISQLHPYFHATFEINIKGKREKIKFWQAINDKDKYESQMLIAKLHHRPAPTRGAILCCSLPDISDEIVGCAILDKMTYTSALHNRSVFLEIEIAELQKKTRGEIVNNYCIAWASRFVVEKNFRGLGIGRLLADKLREMAAIHNVPASNFIEVYATAPMSIYNKYNESSKGIDNFLTRGGYFVNKDYKQTTNLSFGFDNNGYLKSEKGKKLYYYSDSRRNQLRLFVPLNSDAYEWFLNHGKQWEVRNCKGNYSAKNVFVGKKVELRKGYSDKESSIWKMVREIRTFNTLNDLFSSINYKLIIPVASSLKEAVDISKKFLKVGPNGEANIIAIKVQ